MSPLSFFACASLLGAPLALAQTSTLPDSGWAKTSVNGVVFRGSSVASFGKFQYTAYYDGAGKVVLAKRTRGSTAWTVKITSLTGTVADAHNSISIQVDGDGFLHLAWDMHGTKLRYCKSLVAGGLDMGPEQAMVGTLEASVTYPQFFRLANGNLLFLYRDGSSGSGDLTLNRYDLKTKAWTRLQTKLVDGEGARNAYWQCHIDRNGVLHLSWVWRETADVSTNHDMCYARSRDGGVTWEKSDGTAYSLPITAASAEYALKIPQKSDLINQTSIFGDAQSRPWIATYWAPAGTGIPQYQLIHHDGTAWKTQQISHRTTAFSLSGVGTKQIPISRPQLVVDATADSVDVAVVFRDVERGDRVSLMRTTNLVKNTWTVTDLTDSTVQAWEPSYDIDLWNSSRILALFVQRMGQGDGETSVALGPQPVQILEWAPPVSTSILRHSRTKAAMASAPRIDISGRVIPGQHQEIEPEHALEFHRLKLR